MKKPMKWDEYWLTFLIKTPERVIAGLISGLTVYFLIRLLGL